LRAVKDSHSVAANVPINVLPLQSHGQHPARNFKILGAEQLNCFTYLNLECMSVRRIMFGFFFLILLRNIRIRCGIDHPQPFRI